MKGTLYVKTAPLVVDCWRVNNMPPVSLKEYEINNEIFLDDACRETGRLFADVAKEYYAFYLESVRDREHD